MTVSGSEGTDGSLLRGVDYRVNVSGQGRGDKNLGFDFCCMVVNSTFLAFK